MAVLLPSAGPWRILHFHTFNVNATCLLNKTPPCWLLTKAKQPWPMLLQTENFSWIRNKNSARGVSQGHSHVFIEKFLQQHTTISLRIQENTWLRSYQKEEQNIQPETIFMANANPYKWKQLPVDWKVLSAQIISLRPKINTSQCHRRKSQTINWCEWLATIRCPYKFAAYKITAAIFTQRICIITLD